MHTLLYPNPFAKIVVEKEVAMKVVRGVWRREASQMTKKS